MAKRSPKVEIVPLTQLQPDPQNANKGTERGMGMLEQSLRQYGAGRSALADRNGVLIAGNKTLEQAVALGFEEALVVHTDGKQLVVVQRDDLDMDGSDARGLAIADNRVGQINLDWSAEQLAALKESHPETLGQFFTEKEIAELLKALGNPQGGDDPGAQIDRAEELRAKWQTVSGQLWLIPSKTVPGKEHRLFCGDSTKPEIVMRLMGKDKHRMCWTDPPYGVSYGAKNEFLNAVARGNHIQTPIENDQLSDEETERVARDALTLACQYGVAGAVCYVACPPGTLLPHFIAALAASGYVFKHSLVWVKNQFVLGRCDYHYRHELVLYGWKKGAHYFVDDHGKDSVFEVDKPHVSDLHPTTKPIELVRPMVENSSKPREIVYDCFSGSGTTLVVAEQSGRLGYGCELDEGYAAVTLERLAKMGLEPRLAE